MALVIKSLKMTTLIQNYNQISIKQILNIKNFFEGFSETILEFKGSTQKVEKAILLWQHKLI